jgi:hypothetical protein
MPYLLFPQKVLSLIVTTAPASLKIALAWYDALLPLKVLFVMVSAEALSSSMAPP